jgi:hypothetical protein
LGELQNLHHRFDSDRRLSSVTRTYGPRNRRSSCFWEAMISAGVDDGPDHTVQIVAQDEAGRVLAAPAEASIRCGSAVAGDPFYCSFAFSLTKRCISGAWDLLLQGLGRLRCWRNTVLDRQARTSDRRSMQAHRKWGLIRWQRTVNAHLAGGCLRSPTGRSACPA